ncbi:hypothetical protein NMG60_11032924 [Bertholletia excelsa]
MLYSHMEIIKSLHSFAYFPSFQLNPSRSRTQIMDLKLGLKISNRVVDDFDLLIAKSPSAPVFKSQETDTLFILSAHLKGYRRGQIKIDINDDGTQILVMGEKLVQEVVMVGTAVHKKETVKWGFRKAFKIPAGVVLDKIKARFNDEESVLTISMPKLVKGVWGIKVEEVKEEEIQRGNSLEIRPNGTAETEAWKQEEYKRPTNEGIKEKVNETEASRTKQLKDQDEEIPKGEDEVAGVSGMTDQASQVPQKGSKICAPVVAGSAILVSIIVFVIHFIRTKNPTSKRRE